MTRKIIFLTLLIIALATSSSVMAAGNGRNANEDFSSGTPFRNLQQPMDIVTMYIGDVEMLMNERGDDIQARLEIVAAQVEANVENSTALFEEQQELQDELIATLTGCVAELLERVEQNQEDVEEALEILEMNLEKAVTAIDSRLYALEGDIEALKHEVDTNTNGVALNAVAILQVDALLHQKVGMIQDVIHATNSMSMFDLERHLVAAQDELASKQHRVLHACSPGYSIRDIAEDGAVRCEADDSTAVLTSYTATRRAIQYSLYNAYAYYAVAYCASGYTISGGGFYKSSNGLKLRYSQPTRSNSGWELHTEYTPYAGSVHVYVRCIRSVSSSSS